MNLKPILMVSNIKIINRLSLNRYRVAGGQSAGTRNQQPVTSCQGPNSGFTLLEVMVALAIMSIVLVSVYKMHSQSLAMNAAARFYTHAPLLAQSKLAELEANSSGDFVEDSGDFGENFPGYSWKVSLTEVASEILGEVAQDLKRIDLTVSLNDDKLIYSLRTYRFDRNL